MTTKYRYALVEVEATFNYINGWGEEPEAEGWAVVQRNLEEYLARFQKTPTAPSAKFVEWEKEER